MLECTLKLFNAVRIPSKARKKAISKITLTRTIKNGYVLDPRIKPSEELLTTIENIVGISVEKANAAFHKSWATVRDTPIEDLVIQQMVHYMTTYGFEALGIYNSDTVYIPNEKLKLPKIKNDIPLIVIKGLDDQEILDKILLFSSGIALKEETINDIFTIWEGGKYPIPFIHKIKNRELKAKLYDRYGLVPDDPTEFLRHLISKLTDESLVIKNKYLINKIKESNGKFLDELLKKAPKDLASIFYRYKPLFLAMKSVSKNKTFFNQLRKRAVKLHKPLPEDYLNSITSHIKKDSLDGIRLCKELEKASIFRKIRLAYALNYRLNPGDSIIYRIRNGRGWVTNFEWSKDFSDNTEFAFELVLSSIAESIKKIIEGKKIYIPKNVNYALPATEKQFTGHFPSGSYVTVPEDMIVGIHWFNKDGKRYGTVDLDLSVIDHEGKIGWNASYRSNGVYFSGDITSAPKPAGASELFYIPKDVNPKILMVNYYNFSEGDEVEMKLFVAHRKVKSIKRNHMIDINNMIASTNINISKEQNVLGLIININAVNRFCFSNVSIGKSISASDDEKTIQARNYLISSFADPIDFKQVLMMAGAKVIDKKPKKAKKRFIDLSPEVINKNSFLELLQS